MCINVWMVSCGFQSNSCYGTSLSLSLSFLKVNGGRASPPDFIRNKSSDQSAEFVEEIQDDRNKCQWLSLDTSWSTFSRFCQITRSSQTLVIIRRLDDGSLPKTSAFLASHIRQRIRLRNTNGQTFCIQVGERTSSPYICICQFSNTAQLEHSP